MHASGEGRRSLRRAGAGDRAFDLSERTVHLPDILLAVAAGAASLEHLARLCEHVRMGAVSSALVALIHMSDGLQVHQSLEQLRLRDRKLARTRFGPGGRRGGRGDERKRDGEGTGKPHDSLAGYPPDSPAGPKKILAIVQEAASSWVNPGEGQS
jgi:hypothetical protein